MTSGPQPGSEPEPEPEPEVPTPEDILRGTLNELRRRARILGRVVRREVEPHLRHADDLSGKNTPAQPPRSEPPKLDDRGPQGR
ncbi:MAG: hypothetical protein U0636_02025 [Phycisphaerales bacterium]